MNQTVEALLNAKGLQYKIQGRDCMVSCLNPAHEDSSPSMRIDKVSGMFHCFSCSYKGNIFKHFGLIVNNTSVRIAKLKEKLASVRVNFEGQPLPEGASPITRPYRGISAKTIQHFEAFQTLQKEILIDRIIFPIKDIRGRTIVYHGRHMFSDVGAKYINYPKDIPLPIYPVRYPIKTDTAFFVEGMFDMLNLYDKGLTNVTCIFGTNTLQKDTAEKLLPLKAQGISKIVLLLDNDEAGKKAVEILTPLIQECDFEVQTVNLNGAEVSDPGEFSQEYVTSIKEYYS